MEKERRYTPWVFFLTLVVLLSALVKVAGGDKPPIAGFDEWRDLRDRRVTYFVIPHPDDEVAAWSLVQRAEFPVFILLTQGEASAVCVHHGGQGSQQCKERRMQAWHGFLDESFPVAERDWRQGFDLYMGATSARVVFDLGDGRLTPVAVRTAIDSVRELRLGGVEELLVADEYGGDEYVHPDHVAVREAVRHYPFPKRALRVAEKSAQAPVVLVVRGYDELMAPAGHFNRHYGWLNPPHWGAPAREQRGWTEWQAFQLLTTPRSAAP